MKNGLITYSAVLLVLCLFILPAVGQEEAAETAETADEDYDETSLYQEWSETLAFGIDSKVIELVSTLKDRRETGLNDELVERFQLSNSNELRRDIFGFFEEFEDPALEDEALDLLLYYYDYDNSIIRAAIGYLGSVELDAPREAAQLLYDLIEEDNTAYSAEAVRALSSFGTDEDAEFFLDILENSESTSGNLVEAILLALGDMKLSVAVDPLVAILEDEFQPMIQRQYAADSLGKIGDPEALPALRNALGSEENMLRAYAVSALSRFPDEDNTGILQQALRDSFLRTREVALNGVASGKVVSALPAVRYMVQNDPEESIRRKAVTTLAELDSPEAWEFLQTHVANEKTPQAMRIQIIQLLVEHNPDGGAEILREIMQEEWDKENSRVLDSLAKAMSTADNTDFETFFVRMLEHPNFVIQMYGVRGISRSGLSQHREKIEALSEEGHHPALRREANSGLERL